MRASAEPEASRPGGHLSSAGAPAAGAPPERLSPRGKPDWRCRSVAVPPCHPVALIEQLSEPVAVCWAPEQGHSFVGLGAAARLRGEGPHRLAQMRDRGTQLLLAATEAADESNALTAPRLFGGFAFDADSQCPAAPWQVFGAAQFVLPRVCYGTDGQHAWLTLCLTPNDDADTAERAMQLFDAAQRVAHSPQPAKPGQVLASAEQERLDPSQFGDRARRLIQAIRSGHAQKVVTAEQVQIRASAPLGDTETLLTLDANAVESTRFLFRLGDYSMIGATPERLISKRGRQLRTEALAGTISASAKQAEEALLSSQKDRGEHSWVQEAIWKTLTDLGCAVDREPTRVRRLHDLLHLRAPFTAQLREPMHVLDVAEHLHPTPAVGGVPTDRAKEFILESEGFERGWYSGAVGWFDASGDGDFDVALRCGVLHARRAWLYAGAGLVVDSVAEQERHEISLKLGTLLSALRTRT